MKKLLIGALISASFASILTASFVSAASLTENQEKQLTVINQILRDNPPVIINLHDSLSEYVASQVQFEQVKQQSHDWLYNNPVHPVTGNPDGNIVVVNFTDYNCPYCKKMESAFEPLVAEFDQLKIINIFVPLQQQQVTGLDTNSALYALNIWQNQPDAFKEVNRLLFAKNSRHTKQSLEAVAKRTNTEKWLNTTNKQKMITERNYQTFSRLGLGGTPAMFVGDQVIPGFMPYEKMKAVLEAQLK